MEKNACPACKKKIRDESEHKALINRLSRIEGQIRGIKRMVDEDAYCIDIINQVSAASHALSSFNKEMLSAHIRGCVANDISEGNTEAVDELLVTLSKLLG